MKNEAKTKSVKLSSLMDSKKQEIQIPKGTVAEHDVSDGPFIFSGNLKNEGTLRVLGSKTSTVEMVFGQILNKGSIECEAGTLSLASSEFSNHGEIKAFSKVRLRATVGKLNVDGKSGSISAETSILLRADGGLKVDGGTYTAGSILFQAKDGKVSVIAEALEGEVEVEAVSANVGTKSGQLDLGQQKLLSGNHVYYNYSGNVSVGGVSHGADPVTILASGNVSASSVAGGEVTIAAGVYFTINGEYPDPTEDSNADVSWEITSSYGYGNIDITGSLTANNATLLGSEVTIGGTVDVTQDLDITTPSPGGGTVEFSGTVTATNATLAAFDVTFSDELTLSENLDIQSAFENGTVLFSADVDIDGDATIIASQIDFEGDDFDIDGVLEMGNSYQGAYINLAGTFTASDDVTFNAYQTKFDGVDFTMDGQDKVLNANSSTRIEASGTIAIDADVETDHAVNLQFYCDGDIKTGSITIDNSQGNWAGGLCIKTNRSGSSSEFIIGGSSNSNGVNGQIITDTVSGGSTDSTSYSYGCVYISNGGTGGITLTNAGDISVKGTSSRSGGITLDAGDGDISLPAGTLSADGTGDHGGSFIQLFADTIETEDGTVISASDNGQSGQQKLVQIAANTVNLTGSTGLTIRSDGDGNAANPTSLQILPKDSIVLDDNDSITYFYYWFTAEDNYWNGADSVEFAGSATAPLNISSNGSHNRVYASAYPLTFNTGETNIECKGEEDHQIDIVRFQASGSAGLVFNGDDVTIDASGPDTGSGDGGQISINIDYISRSSTGKVTVKADGKGDGDGGHIIFYPGAVSSAVQLGLNDEQFAFSAKGGSTSGNGGQVELWGWSASIAVYDAGLTSTPINVSAPGTDGDGGQIDIVAYGSNGLTFDGTASYIKADSGSSSGNGGRITILASNAPITIDTGSSGAVSLSAVSNGDGDGGTIDVTCWAGITAESAHVDVTADGDGTGGTIKLNAGYSTFTLNGGELHADGGDTGGNGGFIHLEGGQILLPAEDNTLLTANGLEGGNGGTIEVVTQWASVNFGSEDGEIQVKAEGSAPSTLPLRSFLVGGAGHGGNLSVIQQNSFTVAAGTTLSVDAYDDGDGGAIVIQCSDHVTVNGPVYADGTGAGEGGTISIEAPTINLGEQATFSADAGILGDGNGGVIALRNGEGTQISLLARDDLMFTARGSGIGEGGRTTIEKVGVFNIFKLIDVEGGSNADKFTPFGTIALNGVVAREWLTEYESWPVRYWKSAYPNDAEDLTVPGYAFGLPSNIKSKLGTNEVRLFHMDKVSDFYSFFGISGELDLLGVSTTGGIKISCVFDKVMSGGVLKTVENESGSNFIKKATTAHELAHQLDVIAGKPSDATGSGTFNAALTTDYNNNSAGHIDFEECDTVFKDEHLDGEVCSLYVGENSEKLEALVGGRYELFAQIAAKKLYPNTNYPALESALSYIPYTLNTWMANWLAGL